MPRKFVYDYYEVLIPRDGVPEEDENHEELFRLAFIEAAQRTRFYAMPCTWTALLHDDPDSPNFWVRVRRKRHRTKRSHFHMLVGMPGYMPDTNYVCLTRGRAEDLAMWEAQQFRDISGYHRGWGKECQGKVVGNKHDGYEIYRRNSVHPDEVYMTIRVTECFEQDCLEELEE